jgi:hypothetical protein
MTDRRSRTMSTVECKETNDSPVWGYMNVIKWKFLPAILGGGRPYLEKYKYAF